MALTVTVTKVWPTMTPTNEDYTIRLDVVLLDNAVEVNRQTFSVEVNKNDVLSNTQQTIDRIVGQVNAWVSVYKKEKVALETIRAGVTSGVSL
jgi:hypothetical protein